MAYEKIGGWISLVRFGAGWKKKARERADVRATRWRCVPALPNILSAGSNVRNLEAVKFAG